MVRRLALGIGIAAVACGQPARQPAARAPDPGDTRAVTASASARATEPARAVARPGSSASATPAAPAGAAQRMFPPPPIPAPFPRSASPTDGEWTELPGAPGTMAVTEIHPHPVSRFQSVHLVAMDLSQLEIGWLPGTADVEAKKLPDISVGLVPQALQSRLLAVFNGGFQPMHGRWGMRIERHVIVPARDAGCTIALARDHTIKIAPWPEIAPLAEELVVYRQTPPCMMTNGELHSKLLANDERPWGGRAKDLVTRRRSALGLDAQARVLYYALGIEVGPRLLTEALRYAGASAAAELDINFNWTRFLVFGRAPTTGELEVVQPLLPDIPFSRKGYVARKSDRDFFYVLRRETQTSE